MIIFDHCTYSYFTCTMGCCLSSVDRRDDFDYIDIDSMDLFKRTVFERIISYDRFIDTALENGNVEVANVLIARQNNLIMLL